MGGEENVAMQDQAGDGQLHTPRVDDLPVDLARDRAVSFLDKKNPSLGRKSAGAIVWQFYN